MQQKTKTIKLLGGVFLAIVMMFCFVPVTGSQAVYAEDENVSVEETSYLEKTSFELTVSYSSTLSYSDSIECSTSAYKSGVKITNATVQDPSIVKIIVASGWKGEYYRIEGVKVGNTTIDVTFNNGKHETVAVSVGWPDNHGYITYKSVTCKAIKGTLTINRSYDEDKGGIFKINTATLKVCDFDDENKIYLKREISVGDFLNNGDGVYTADFNVTYPSYYNYYEDKEAYLSFIDSDGDETGRSLSNNTYSVGLPGKETPRKLYDYVRVNKISGYFISKNIDIAEFLENDEDSSYDDYHDSYESNSYLSKGWVVVKGKKYNLSIKEGAYFKVSYPMQKLNTKVTLHFVDSDGLTWTQTKKIRETEPARIRFSKNCIYKNEKTVKVVIKKAKKGDKAILKIGGKTYTKKFKSNKATYKHRFKVKKTQAGQKMVLYLKDKRGNIKARDKTKVYYASKIRKGMTKQQVKLIPGWGSPDKTSIYGNYTTWYYDGYSEAVYFYNGKVTGWTY